MVELIASQEAVALIGAGVSVAAGYESWPNLMQQLVARADLLRPGFAFPPKLEGGRDFIAVAQQVRDHIADPTDASAIERWYDEIGQLFYRSDDAIRGRLTSLHRDIVRLPFRAFLTTNIEEVLEVAIGKFHPGRPHAEGVAIWNGDVGLVSRAVRSIAVPDETIRYVIHLHGKYRPGSTLVLCADEYAKAYGIPELALLGPRDAEGMLPTRPRNPSRPTRLFLLTTALLATRRVVFLGFSFDDVYFTEVLTRVSTMLWEWQSDTHYAVMPLVPSEASDQLLRAADLKSRCGIETVFYPLVDGNYAALDNLIARIAGDVERIRPSQPVRREAVGQPIEATPSAMPAWVSRINTEQLSQRDQDED